MATGDILSITIGSDGWYADITVEGLSTGGSYAFGLGSNNIPTSSKIIFSLTSEGYSTSGVLGTKTRTVYGIPCMQPDLGAMRNAYPSATTAQETISGSDVIIRIALSEYIYNDDTNITATISSGWYTQDGTATNSVNSLTVTNNSTLDYPKVIANWAVPKYQTFIGTTVHLEVSAFHKFAENGNPCACIRLTGTDGTNTVTSTATSMSISEDSPYASIIVYEFDVNVSSLTNLSTITWDFIAYPWIGDADSIINTADAVNTNPTPLYAPLTGRLDKNGVHGHCVVDATNGSDSTGTVYSSQTLAEAGYAYSTIAAALAALATYNNTYAGHSDAGGGTIYLVAGTYTFSSANGGTLSEWVTITKHSAATQSTVIFQASANNASIPTKLKLSGVTISGSYYFSGSSSTKSLYLYDNVVNTTGAMIIYTTPYSVAHNCTGVFANGFLSYGTTKLCWALIRGVQATTLAQSIGWVVLGCEGVSLIQRSSTSSSSPLNENGIYAYNFAGDNYIYRLISIAKVENLTHGFALVQNILKRSTSATELLAGISNDSTTTTTNNVIIHHNVFVGAPCNLGYNDITSGGPYAQLNWSVKNNIFSNFNNKDDTFGSNASATGGWPIGYWVGASGNFVRTTATQEWMGEFPCGLYSSHGTYLTPVSVEYVTDNSYEGNNTTGGDYHLLSTSPCLTLAHDLVLPYDFEGKTRTVDNASGAYIYDSGSTTPSITTVSDSTLYDGETNVVITGTYFGSTAGTVTINSSADGTGTSSTQTVTSWADTSITITVIQGNLIIGTAYIIVTDSSGISSESIEVEIYATPVITTVSDSTLYDGETNVVITGTYFGSTAGTVTINSSADGTGTSSTQTVTSWADTSITFTTARGSLSYGTNYLIITNSENLSNSGYEITLQLLPTITSLNQTRIINNETIVITGTDFGSTAGTVTINSAADGTGTSSTQTVTSWADTVIIFTSNVGDLSYGTNYLIVTDSSGSPASTTILLVTTSTTTSGAVPTINGGMINAI